MTRKTIAAGILAVALAAWWFGGKAQPAPAPSPAPAAINLRGLFIGPDAATDAVAYGCLCEELAGVIEWDYGLEGGPRLKTGAAFDDLRRHAREGRMRGESLGAKQPKARDAIALYMEKNLGTGGGPVDDAQRSKWITTLRDIGEACRDAAR